VRLRTVYRELYAEGMGEGDRCRVASDLVESSGDSLGDREQERLRAGLERWGGGGESNALESFAALRMTAETSNVAATAKSTAGEGNGVLVSGK
jgi:hypothetical protein